MLNYLGATRLRPIGATTLIGIAFLMLVMLASVFAPLIANHDPGLIAPGMRLRAPDSEFMLGTDAYGRDVFSRILYGGRVSLVVGLGAAALSISIGSFVGIVAGYWRLPDAILMRLMDGLMAIPGVLLAIAVVSLTGANLATVLIAITIPEIPRVARLVRSVVIGAREEAYVEAAVTLGTPAWRLLIIHLLPATLAPLLVQGTYIFASAVLTEAILSFLGLGIGAEIPSWGNIMAEGRAFFQLKPTLVLWPGLILSLLILSINQLGDFARDILDPRLARRGDVA